MNTRGIYIPERFEKVVTLHLLKNKIADGSVINPPLILGIDGLPGTGKTFQCKNVLEKLNYSIITITGSELENKNAGEPAELIREKYIDANYKLKTQSTNGVALIFDDLDVFIGDWGSNVQYTVNRQLVLGELMALADNPYQVGDQQTERIPIIVTGNDFTKLYEPLTRPGRFERFTWIPSNEEIIDIATAILDFADRKLVKKLTLALIDIYQKKGQKVIPISFFSHLKATIIDDAIWEYYKQNRSLDRVNSKEFKEYFLSLFKNSNFSEMLVNKASHLSKQTKFDSHFRG